MNEEYLDFEEPISDLKKKLDDLSLNDSKNINKQNIFQKKIDEAFIKIYSTLTPWQRVQVARHPNRPHTSDYINNLITNE